MNQQSVIPVSGTDELTFDNFHSAANSALVALLQAIARGNQAGKSLYLWGEAGSGKTHLLNAVCDQAASSQRPFSFLSAAATSTVWDFTRLADSSIVCIDYPGSAQRDREQPARELELLSLYERLTQGGGNLVVSGRRPPAEQGFVTPDLVSRLTAGGVYHLQPLDDAGKREVLAWRARTRGFELSPAVVDYIMNRLTRDTASLFALLDRVDSVSLAQHRRITIPFIRDLIDSS